MALDDARGDDLKLAELRGSDRALAIERLAERIDDAAQHGGPDRDFDDAAGFLHRVALFDLGIVANEHRANRILFEVQREAHDAAGELEELSHLAVRQAVDARDAVADLEHRADVFDVDFALERLELALQNRCNFFGSNCHGFLRVSGLRFAVGGFVSR